MSISMREVVNFEYITDSNGRPKVLGRGGFGIVYAGRDLDTKLEIVVKEIDLNNHDGDLEILKKEIALHSEIRHENIVCYLGSVSDNAKCIKIFMEFVPGGSLAKMCSEWGALKKNEVLLAHYSKQILLGLKYLHDQNIVHRDIKSDNILVNNYSGIAKIADFGLSKRLDHMCPATTRVGTLRYMAPEVLNRRQSNGYEYPVDIWSLGCTMVEMSTGARPYPGLRNIQQFVETIGDRKEHPILPDELSNEAKNFIMQCFAKIPEERATARELLKDPFLSITKTTHFEKLLPTQLSNLSVQLEDNTDSKQKTIGKQSRWKKFYSSIRGKKKERTPKIGNQS